MIISNKIRTNKLWCSICGVKFKKGVLAYFAFEEEKDDSSFGNIYCETCAAKLRIDIKDINNESHPFSGEAIGQD